MECARGQDNNCNSYTQEITQRGRGGGARKAPDRLLLSLHQQNPANRGSIPIFCKMGHALSKWKTQPLQ